MSMVSPESRTVALSLTVSRFWIDPGVHADPSCLACGESLLIHQPDINAPERLLGTCDDCGSWHLIDWDRAITVLLPDADGLRNDEVND